MVDIILNQIKAELTRQSKQIINIYHAFDLLETSEVVRSNDLKTACLTYMKNYLANYATMNQLLAGRKISLETQLRLKGVLLSYQLGRIGNPGGNILNEMRQVADDFSTISLENALQAAQ